MKKFKFRLEKVLEYRTLAEKWAKEAYVECKLNTFECEGELDDIRARRSELLKQPVGNVIEHKAVELLMERLDEDERAKQAALQVLRDEEAQALEVWKTKRQEVRALELLRDEAIVEWQQLVNKSEQDELDEWTNTRRAA